MKDFAKSIIVKNARTDVTYKGRALTDAEIRKLTDSQKNEIMKEYEKMVRSGAISDSEMAEAMDSIRYWNRTGNSKVGNARQLVYQKDYEHGIEVKITKDSQRDDDFFWSLFDGPSRVAFGSTDSLSKAQSQSHAAAKRREKLYKE